MSASEKMVRPMDQTRQFRGMSTQPALGLDGNGAPVPQTDFNRTVDTLRNNENLHNPEPKPYTTFTLAYDRQQHTELAKALASGDVQLMHNALTSATSSNMQAGLATTSYRVQEVPGLLNQIAALTTDGPTNAIQRMALKLINQVLAKESVSRAAILCHPPVCQALQTCSVVPDAVRRRCAYDTVAVVAETGQGAEACVQLGFVTLIVNRVREEVPLYAQGGVHQQPLDAALAALQRLLANTQTDAAREAIAAQAAAVLVEVLHVRGATRSTLSSSLRCLGYLAVEQKGKEAVVAEERASGAVTHLLSLVMTDDAAVIAGAASVLTGTLLEDECKRVVLDGEHGLGPFLDVLEVRHGDDDVPVDLASRVPKARPAGRRHVMGSHLDVTQAKINACTALATVTAHPRARAALCQPPYDAPRKLQALITSAEDQASEERARAGGHNAGVALLMQVAATAKRAHDTITWKP